MSASLIEALKPLIAPLKQLIKDAVLELIDERKLFFDADKSKRKLAEINAQIYITVPEAEFLFRCSDSFFYRQINLAQEGRADPPIPYQDRGIYTFPREKLIAWMALRKPSAGAEPAEGTHLKEVA
jgi:hypothetical protein